MTHSESVKNIAAALVAAQAEMENPKKNASNPHFKSRYADLPEILEHAVPVLNKHGIAVTQLPGFEDGICTLVTMFVHTSGEWIKGTSGAPIAKADPQGVGSAITYLRRYSLAAACGIAQDDDDGNAASLPPRDKVEQYLGPMDDAPDITPAPPTPGINSCPNCGGRVYDNRGDNAERKRQGKKPMPEFACRDKQGCGWVKWGSKSKAAAVVGGDPFAEDFGDLPFDDR